MIEDVKINSNVLTKLIQMLEFIKDEERIDFIEHLLDDVEQAKKDAQKYAESNNVDYNIAIERVISEKELYIDKYCKYEC